MAIKHTNAVELVGHYGGDRTHALSAWTSTSRDIDEAKWSRMPQLLAYLAEHEHHTPFEKSSLHFLVRCDTATHIQFLKHRIGVSINAESARYKELQPDKYYYPEDWNDYDPSLANVYASHMERAYDNYHMAIQRLVEAGMDRARAKESARFFLPYGGQIVLDVMFNFRSFMHFYELRAAETAQKEIRELAYQMMDLVMDTQQFDYSISAFHLYWYGK